MPINSIHTSVREIVCSAVRLAPQIGIGPLARFQAFGALEAGQSRFESYTAHHHFRVNLHRVCSNSPDCVLLEIRESLRALFSQPQLFPLPSTSLDD